MADITNAYQLQIGIFKQDGSGTAYAKLPEEFASIKWDLSASIVPVKYDFTNFQVGDTTIETVEKNTITALTKDKKFDSGALTPPTLNFATLLPADAAYLVKTLNDLTGIEDAFKVLFTAGIYKTSATTTRTYDVFMAAVGIVTTDGGRSGEAKQTFNGSLGLQCCHLPIIGTTACDATLTQTIASGAIAFAVNPAQSNPQ